jgi:Winged helix DNA-binding domain
MPSAVLDARALNRALLVRQGLLSRSDSRPLDMIERLVGMQAQEPENPYVALWLRLRDFRPSDLSELIAERRAARAQLMRGTIHLVSARDCLRIHPLTQPLLARMFKTSWGKGLAGADAREVAVAGLELLAERPRTRAELRDALAPRWPDADPASLAHAVTYNLALVQVPPRGLWRTSGQASWAPAESFLGGPLASAPSPDELVWRYLAAFGPASSADVRTWCGLTGLRDVVARLRPRLRVFRDENGRELLDVPDGPLPDPETPAPPRYLPEYDNVTLAHADRSRVLGGLGPGEPFPTGKWIGALLVDGFYRANWKAQPEGTRAALTIDRFRPLPGDPRDTADAIEAEGMALLGFIAPEADDRRVVFSDAPPWTRR